MGCPSRQTLSRICRLYTQRLRVGCTASATAASLRISPMYSSGVLRFPGSVVPEIDWDELETLGTEQFHDRHFRELGPTLVPGEGDNPIAFIIGEAPGAQEVIKGRPFVGPSGRVQRQLMSFAGLHVRGTWFRNDEPESN